VQGRGGGSRAVVMIVDGDEVVVWEPPVGVRPNLDVIERLARLRLAARRRGYEVRLRDPCADMVALIKFVGLASVFGLEEASVEVIGQPEGGEQPGIEEVVQPDELAVGDLEDLDRKRGPTA
jgi:hypothetical protein